jgi:hypothetical protein
MSLKMNKNQNQPPPCKKLKSDVKQITSSMSSMVEKTIPVEQLLNYNIFRFLQKDQDKAILKDVKLAYVFGDSGFIVTTKDDVYSLGEVNGLKKEDQDQFGQSFKKVSELCGLKIKGQ